MEVDTPQFKKKWNLEKFKQSKIEIEEMVTQTDRGEINLSYVDETGFALPCCLYNKIIEI